jgi:hypothetical protein
MEWTVEQLGSHFRTFAASLTPEDRIKVAALVRRLAEEGNMLGLPHSKALGDNLFELRAKSGGRVFYTFRAGRRIILLGGILKKRGDLPKDVLREMRDRAKAVP